MAGSWIERADRVLMPTYGRRPVTFVRGAGCRLWDDAGKRYLDLAAGIGCCCLGHGDARLAAAIGEQAARLIQVSNLYYSEPMVAVAEGLCTHSFGERVFFCNSGAEANEGAIKLARKRSRDQFGPGRFRVLGFRQSFHGRTLATLSATGQAKVWKGFEPLVEGFDFADYGDLASVEQALTDAHCAILVEPIQGEGGIVVPPAGFLAGLRRLCDERDLTLIFDCVQCGMGRTGKLFAHQHEGVRPDVMTVAKGLGGGVPIGAIVATEAAGTVLTPGSHASTFGGNPLVCAAARVVLDALTEGGVIANAAARSTQFFAGLAAIQGRVAGMEAVRGRGLMIGVALDAPVAPILDRLRAAGVIALAAGERVLRLLPPLVISAAEVEEGLAAIEQALRQR
ncbi:MAG: aspartate aminotransferase family protein [Nitrospirae bacterium CG2_30_70_394]|nr:MAG: aspartate aminotransferase family protein [Nitrospirae bacterium CG2_30_70_394]